MLESAYKNKGFVHCMFILARTIKVFCQAIVQATLLLVHVTSSKELYWFWSGHGFDMASQCSIRVATIRFL